MVPIVDWHERALALGWLTSDLDALASVLALPSRKDHRTDAVVAVGRRCILLFRQWTYTIAGYGGSNPRDIATSGYWKWHHYPPPISSVVDRGGEPTATCLNHGNACAGVARGCTTDPESVLVSLIVDPIVPEPWRRSRQPNTPTTRATPAPEDAPRRTQVPARPEGKRKRGAPLPGQMPLMLEGSLTADEDL